MYYVYVANRPIEIDNRQIVRFAFVVYYTKRIEQSGRRTYRKTDFSYVYSSPRSCHNSTTDVGYEEALSKPTKALPGPTKALPEPTIALPEPAEAFPEPKDGDLERETDHGDTEETSNCCAIFGNTRPSARSRPPPPLRIH